MSKSQTTVTISCHLSPELRFLIACCQAQPDPDEISLQMKSEKVKMKNWEEIVSLAARHGVLPIVYKTLKTLPTTHYPLPTDILQKLKTAYMSIAHRNMLMTAELLRIMKLLQENGIDALAFKGPVLSQMAYGDITLRQYGDLDILIKKESRFRAMEVLEAQGYRPEIMLRRTTREFFFNAVNVMGLIHPSNGVYVEVHWELLSKNYAVVWQERDLWKEIEEIEINGDTVATLSSHQHLIYLCIHGAKHLFERLEWICDIDRSVRSHTTLDWEALISQADRMGVKRMVCLGLSLSRDLLGTPLPELIIKEITWDNTLHELQEKIIQTGFADVSGRVKSYGTFGLLWQMRESLRDRIRFLWRGMFAPKFDDFVMIQLPGKWAYLYPLVRPLRLILKYFKR